MKRWLKGETGTSLLELMVAVGIIGCTGVAFLGALGTTSRSAATIDAQVVGEQLAREVLAQVMSQPWNSTYTVTVTPPSGCNFSLDTGTAPPTAAKTNGSNLQRIAVNVSCGGRPAVSVATYRHKS